MGSRTVVLWGKLAVHPSLIMMKGWRCIPVWPVQCLYRLRVEVFHGLLVASAHAVLGTRVTVERIYRLGDSHLGRRHCYPAHQHWTLHTAPYSAHPGRAPLRESRYPLASFCS